LLSVTSAYDKGYSANNIWVAARLDDLTVPSQSPNHHPSFDANNLT